MKIAIKKLSNNTIMPTISKKNSNSVDVYALEDNYVYPGQTKVIKTGISLTAPNGYAIRLDSAIDKNEHSSLIVTDFKEEGECQLFVHNLYNPTLGYDDQPIFNEIKRGELVARASLMPLLSFVSFELEEVE